MGNEGRVPELRFEGFTGEWEEHELTDVLSPVVRNNTLSRDKLNYDFGEVKNIHYGDILIKFGSFVDATNSEIPFITNGKAIDFKNYLLQDGDLIFADTAEDETAGKVVEVINTLCVNIVSGLHTIVYRPHIKFANGFMGYYLNTNAYRQQLLPLMQGAKVLSLGRNHLATTLILYTSFLEEQSIISDFFRNLDETITQKKQQYEQTLNIKKAMLEKMFPKKGADVPEIRFDGFNGVWETKKLSELGKIITGSTPPTNDSKNYSDDGMIWVTPTDIDSLITYETAKMLSLKGQQIARIVPPFTILVTCIASIGKNTMVISDASLNQQLNALLPYSIHDPYFLLTQSEIWSQKMISIIAATTMQIVNKSKFEMIETLVPKREEQAAIGNFFRNLDTLIAAQQQELEKLQNIKKAFLSKMFV